MLHRKVASVIKAPITDVILIGNKAKWIGDEVMKSENPPSVFNFDQKEEALDKIEELLSPETVVLFKASRMAALETLIASLKN